MPKLIIDNTHFSSPEVGISLNGEGTAALGATGPGLSVDIDNASFSCPRPIVAKKADSLNVINSDFRETDDAPRKYFGGFSFSKGDHLK